ncbi:MAG: 5'/3'-nucleotidase SurE [Bacillota bacterium]|nr:5'/3'-nucleotidase SurE [Bacillota bacterium]
MKDNDSKGNDRKAEKRSINILLTNDDGIYATGINELAKALAAVADIYICAPEEEKSATSHSITVRKPFAVREVDHPAAVWAASVAGTPADCVKVAVKVLRSRGVELDMVFSGINHGANLGTDTLYSGTVQAAVEGALCDKPSVAVSVNSLSPKNWEPACRLAVNCAKKAYGRLDKNTVLNINLPDVPEEDLKGVRYTRLGIREYDDWVKPYEGNEKVREKKQDGEEDEYIVMPQKNHIGGRMYIYGGQPVFFEELEDDVDIKAMQDGYASITPIKYDMTDHELIDEVKDWKIEE